MKESKKNENLTYPSRSPQEESLWERELVYRNQRKNDSKNKGLEK